jgi:site-specific recombinase XerD
MTTLQSLLADPMAQFLAYHRALGKRFDTEAATLQLLDRYLLEQQVVRLEAITPALLEAFLGTRPRASARSYNHLLNVLRRFFAWLERRALLRPNPLRSHPRRATGQPLPFLFEPAQVEQLLHLAEDLPDARRTHRRGAAYRMSFALMYSLGLRVGEVARLCRQDIDWERHCLTIRQTKFTKTRLVPVGPHLEVQLRRYLDVQDVTGPAFLTDPLISLSRDHRQPLSSHSISRAFHRLLPQLELTIPAGVAAPRLHCLRHSFAVGTLLRWYRSGVDPNVRLSRLSTFLGHVDPTSTAVYLTITDALLAEASTRFERFASSALQEVRRP